MAHWAVELADQDFELLLVYLRSVDLASHRYWKFFRSKRFPNLEQQEIELHRDRIPSAYEFVDQTLGAILASAPEANVFVVSDHGFKSLPREITRIVLDLDRVFEKLGYLEYSADGVDISRSRVYTYATPKFREAKRVRFALAGREPDGAVRPEERDEIRRQLTADLEKVSYASGGSVFRVRDAQRKNERGGDFVVEVRKRSASREIFWQDQTVEGAIESVSTISGTHDGHTHGIFAAAGPDIDRAARLEGIRVHDITPTLLYGLGLPIGEDFAGRAWTELFRRGFRRRHPLKTIASWGSRDGSEALTSEADAGLIEELRALGYLD
jgi:predicted AlkP superfamily phosphohydrolase/phosphomutase